MQLSFNRMAIDQAAKANRILISLLNSLCKDSFQKTFTLNYSTEK